MCVICVKVRGDGEHVETLRPDVYDDSLLLDDLRPSTEYSFEVVVGNALGQTTPLVSNASTPIGRHPLCACVCVKSNSLSPLSLSITHTRSL